MRSPRSSLQRNQLLCKRTLHFTLYPDHSSTSKNPRSVAPSTPRPPFLSLHWRHLKKTPLNTKHDAVHVVVSHKKSRVRLNALHVQVRVASTVEAKTRIPEGRPRKPRTFELNTRGLDTLMRSLSCANRNTTHNRRKKGDENERTKSKTRESYTQSLGKMKR